MGNDVQPGQQAGVGEDESREPGTINRTVGLQKLRSELATHGGAEYPAGLLEVVNDVVRIDDLGPALRK